MRDPALSSPAVLAYGRLAIGTLAGVAAASSAALTLGLLWLASAPGRLAGLPYADLPIALLAIGWAAALACLAGASAFFAQVALARRTTRTLQAAALATGLLMSAAFLAFAAGGAVFSHFALAAAARFAQPARGGAGG